jgi:hypothetical protein
MHLDRLKSLAGIVTEATHNEGGYDIRKAIQDITHGTDGPVTAFVILSRATEGAKRTGNDRLYADAAYEALVSHGFMKDHEAERASAPAVNTADHR